jgi:Domain of unknown function (DUF4271)
MTYQTVDFRFSLLIFFSSITLSIYGQVRNNPFEIKPRLNAVTQKTIPTIINSIKEDSAASIGRVDTIGVDIKSTSIRVDKIANPFDIDHVPLRKSSGKTADQVNKSVDQTKTSNTFLFWFLLLSCAILAIVLNIKAKAIPMIYKSLLNENMLKLFYREERPKSPLYFILLYLIFVINISVFAYLTLTYFGSQKGIVFFLSILALVTILYIVRHMGLKILGGLFSLEKNTDLFSFTIMIFNLFSGIIILPINFFLAFGPDSIKLVSIGLVAFCLGLLFFLRSIRGLFIASEYFGSRIFQIFVYLCAFEIAPVLILVKTILKYGFIH